MDGTDFLLSVVMLARGFGIGWVKDGMVVGCHALPAMALR
jgi:hypothetical protein